MTDELTLREKARSVILDAWNSDTGCALDVAVDRIATILEDTSSPAHMRVAAELRGE